jgi:hypothetical protein
MTEGYDMVNGWRRDRADTAAKRMVSHIYNFLTARILKCDVHDINCGFKVLNRQTYKRLDLHGDMHRLIPAIVVSQGGKVAEVPVDHVNRKHGMSRYHLLRHRGLLDIVSLAAAQSTQLRPFHVFFELGFVLLVGGFLGGLLWCWMTALGPDTRIADMLRSIIGFFTAWLLLFGSLLPLLGFLMENGTSRRQDEKWRRSLIKKIHGPTHIGTSAHDV